MKISKVYSNLVDSEFAVIALCGRSIPVESMNDMCEDLSINVSYISVEPINREWYPSPNGRDDQEKAVNGMKESVEELENFINKQVNFLGIQKSNIAILGYSAGAVMAIQLCAKSDSNYAAVVSLCGAILEPENLPEAKNTTPILLQHNIDDLCFSWEERYLPMKKALKRKKYNISVKEKDYGGHGLVRKDIDFAANFLNDCFRGSEII